MKFLENGSRPQPPTSPVDSEHYIVVAIHLESRVMCISVRERFLSLKRTFSSPAGTIINGCASIRDSLWVSDDIVRGVLLHHKKIRDDILIQRPVILRDLLIVATPYPHKWVCNDPGQSLGSQMTQSRGSTPSHEKTTVMP